MWYSLNNLLLEIRDFLLFSGMIRKTAESAEGRREKNTKALLNV